MRRVRHHAGRAVLLLVSAVVMLPASTGSLTSNPLPRIAPLDAALFTRVASVAFEPVRERDVMRSAALPVRVAALEEEGGKFGRFERLVAAERAVKAERGARVAASFDRASILRTGLATGDDEMRTALAGPQSTTGRIAAAMNFTARHPEIRMAMAEPPVLPRRASTATAAAIPAVEPGAVGRALKGFAESRTVAAALAYAPASTGRPGPAALFDMILGRPALPEDADHAWAAAPLPSSVFSDAEQRCLATGIYFEARGESEAGQAAVAQVMLNRVRSPAFPDSICGVVYQNQTRRHRCQFSFACDGVKDRILNQAAYTRAQRVALAVTKGELWNPEVGSATHYHASYVKPRWANAMQKVDSIGMHVFYRTFGGGWN